MSAASGISVVGHGTFDEALHALTAKLVGPGKALVYICPSLAFRVNNREPSVDGGLASVVPLPSYREITVVRTNEAVGVRTLTAQDQKIDQANIESAIQAYSSAGIQHVVLYHSAHQIHSDIASRLGLVAKFHLQIAGENNAKTVGITPLA